MKVYRCHLRPAPANGASEAEIFDFCYTQKIIGIGYSAVKSRNEAEAEAQFRDNYDAGIANLRAMMKIEIGDFLWIHDTHEVYYLCKAVRLWKDQPHSEECAQYDVSNNVGVEMVLVGSNDQVPEKVLAAFTTPMTLQPINDEGLAAVSNYIWNIKHK